MARCPSAIRSLPVSATVRLNDQSALWKCPVASDVQSLRCAAPTSPRTWSPKLLLGALCATS
eukprot:10438858-Alexandrium_andersonii.AAC.1